MNTKAMKNVLSATTDQEKLAHMTAEALRLGLRLDNGRHYLMSTSADNITVEDCLEAFGFTKDGLGELTQ